MDSDTKEQTHSESKAEDESGQGQDVQEDGASKVDAKKEKERLKKLKQKEKDKAKKDAAKKKDEPVKKKAPVSLIKEALKKKQEDEQRAKEEEEAEEKRLNEIAKQKEEKARIEQERKDREKQKKKDRIARQKADGTFMTAEDRAKLKRRQEQMQMLRDQGLLVTGSEAKKENKQTAKAKKAVLEKQNSETQESQSSSTQGDSQADKENEEGAPDSGEEEDAGSDSEAVADDWETLQHPDNSHLPADHTVNVSEEVVCAPVARTSADSESAASVTDSVSTKDTGTGSANNYKVHETKEQIHDRIRHRIKQRVSRAMATRTSDHVRAPIICVLGHVDTGKTKMLDKIRRTNVQDGEAGGITQQIGATQVPDYCIKQQGQMVNGFKADRLKIPGFLIIDTPGHESFRNLRSRGSSMCDMAILIVDIMHGLEPQTLESIDLLLQRKCPFVVALNKVDRIYEWQSDAKRDIRDVLKAQKPNATHEFNEKYKHVFNQFAEKSINVCMFWENEDPNEYVSVVPTSAVSGDGVGNLMVYLAQYTQTHLLDKITFNEALDSTVLEVKQIAGLGTTIDVILVNGRLRVGDRIVLAGSEGPIITPIRDLLMPQPLKEMRVKNPYEHFKEVKGAQGIKILAKDLDHALAGLPLLVAEQDDEVDYLRHEVQATLHTALAGFRVKSVGVYVQASTLGSLEALLEFLKSQKIPYCGINIGPVHKKDVMKASTMFEHEPEMAVILAFDVPISRESQQLADEMNVKIFSADIIYHLQDAFLKHRQELRDKARREHQHLAIFPCKLRVLPNYVFKTRDPIVAGVLILDGNLKPGTPLFVPDKDVFLGTVSSIEHQNKAVDIAKKDMEVCIKIENTTGDAPRTFGRHFDENDNVVSRITRDSIDVCKEYFRDDLTKDDWRLMVELKRALKIM